MKLPQLAAVITLALLATFSGLGGPGARAAEAAARAGDPVGVASALDRWSSAVDDRLVDYYEDAATGAMQLPMPESAWAAWSDGSRTLVKAAGALAAPAGSASAEPFPFVAGRLRARAQQAVVIELAAAVRAGKIDEAKALRAALSLPRGVSSAEGALLLQALGSTPGKRDEAARLLAREAITWQTTRVRQLLDQATRAAQVDLAMPGRLMERIGEATALADLPDGLRAAAGIPAASAAGTELPARLAAVGAVADRVTDDLRRKSDATGDWKSLLALPAEPLTALRREIQEKLPSLLTSDERVRRERLLLKLCELVPREYASGVRDGQVSVPLEYREAVTFTQQARQIVGELAPLWLADQSRNLAPAVEALDAKLEQADGQIAAKQSADQVEKTLGEAATLLKDTFGINLRRSGTTADIVDEVMLETRSLLTQSLSAALAGKWDDAERLRVEAYTTYDPELEARLMPRDPQLALDIERLLLDGIDEPGVKALLDRRAPADELQAGYARVTDGLGKAAALLKSGISPTAAAMNAASIVLREGLEGLLVIVAIFAGLRGEENARRRRLFWVGILASLVATAVTWLLSQTVMTSLRAYGEVIAAVTGILAIGVLLLITNWLFHQVYWKQWVTTLKAQATEGESIWQLMLAGFLVGYREGFETVLFLQSLVLDAGGTSVAIGVAAGSVLLLALGFAALYVGMKLPYFKILLVTAVMIGVVLITFVGGTVRAAQTVGWLPVHRLMPGSWPSWLGTWLGFYNTWESVAAQVVTVLTVVGTWRIARFQAKRKTAKRRQEQEQQRAAAGGARSVRPTTVADRKSADNDHLPDADVSLPGVG